MPGFNPAGEGVGQFCAALARPGHSPVSADTDAFVVPEVYLATGASLAVENRTSLCVGRKYLPCNLWYNPTNLSKECEL